MMIYFSFLDLKYTPVYENDRWKLLKETPFIFCDLKESLDLTLFLEFSLNHFCQSHTARICTSTAHTSECR